MTKLTWIAYYHDFNLDKIKTFNVFDHSGFYKDVKTHLKKCECKGEFADQLRRSLFYYYCSKCEWEVVIKPWVSGKDEIKIDVYQQVMNNFEVFVDYVWNSKRRTKTNETNNL